MLGRRMRFAGLVVLVGAMALGAVQGAIVREAAAQGRPPTSPPSAPGEVTRTERPLVFVAMTGLEDLQTLGAVFRHAQTAAERHRTGEVVVLVYGRAVQAFDASIEMRPPALREGIASAMRAGVRILVCNVALTRMGVDAARLDPAPTAIVPNGMDTLLDYVVRDAAIISY